MEQGPELVHLRVRLAQHELVMLGVELVLYPGEGISQVLLEHGVHLKVFLETSGHIVQVLAYLLHGEFSRYFSHGYKNARRKSGTVVTATVGANEAPIATHV